MRKQGQFITRKIIDSSGPIVKRRKKSCNKEINGTNKFLSLTQESMDGTTYTKKDSKSPGTFMAKNLLSKRKHSRTLNKTRYYLGVDSQSMRLSA